MTNYTADQIALQDYLKAEAAKSAAWAAEEEGRWACSYTSDLDHWAEMDVYSIEDLHRYDAIACYSDGHKEVYGYRDRYTDLDGMTTDEINEMTRQMYKRREDEEMFHLECEAHNLNRLSDELSQPVEVLIRWGVG